MATYECQVCRAQFTAMPKREQKYCSRPCARSRVKFDNFIKGWRADEDAKLRELAAEGLTAKQMVAHVGGRTPKAIMQRLARLRRRGLIPKAARQVPPNPRAYTPENEARALELRARGMTGDAIVAETGLPERQVRRILEKGGVNKRISTPAEPRPVVPVGTPVGLIAGCRPVGLHDAWRWWQQQGRDGRPGVAEINELRRSQGRPSFTIIGGRLTVGGTV